MQNYLWEIMLAIIWKVTENKVYNSKKNMENALYYGKMRKVKVMQKAVYNLVFPDYCNEITIAGYRFMDTQISREFAKFISECRLSI